MIRLLNIASEFKNEFRKGVTIMDENMKKSSIFIKYLMLIGLFVFANISDISAKTSAVNDRWLEIDLYWFEHKDMENSVVEFWERFHPLIENVEGWNGVILNVGWTSEYILEWAGELKEPMALPKNMKTYPMWKDSGQLPGTTSERIQLWKERLANAKPPEIVNYEKWTYGDLKKLTSLIRDIGITKYNLKSIKVGSLVFGSESVYHGDKMNFVKRHPNAFWNRRPNIIAKLSSDNKKYGAYPNGVPDKISFVKFFGKQWGSFSKAIGLDVIILRDAWLGVGIYKRFGPYGLKAPADPQKVKEWSEATATLVKETKLANPKALVIGYSSAASAIGDWRVNCFDLEAIAKEGYLDGWIDQTWAGAWGEIAQRPSIFWNRPDLGWTYQLGFLLGHAAILADTKVHHYFLTETYDAWESWDVIHNAKERLRWGIWAYSHAAVKKPDGLKMPIGNYISWCNQGKRLLSKEDVKFLSETSNAAFHDAHETKEIFGPTLVYTRSAMEWQSNNKPDVTIKEWIDEQAGSLMKWSVPILSITRSEYLPRVKSDMFVLQTPVHLEKKEKKNIIKLLKSGKPIAVFGSTVGGLDQEIATILGVSTTSKQLNEVKFIGSINGQTEGIYTDMPNMFPIYQQFSKNESKPGVDVIYSVSDSPSLLFNQEDSKQIIYWDTPARASELPSVVSRGKALDERLGSPTPYAITARLFNKVMRNNNLINVLDIQQNRPLNYNFWKLNDGSYRIMAANLEEGINHTADHSVTAVINLPETSGSKKSIEVTELWKGSKRILNNKKLNVHLEQAETKLFGFKLK